jgi:hypothetical protein
MKDQAAGQPNVIGTKIRRTEEAMEKRTARGERALKKMRSTYTLPSATGEKLANILKAYVIASRQGAEAVTYKDVAAVAGVHPTEVSRNNAFLSESQFILPERYGYYKPSPETTEFAKHVPWDEAGAKEYIRRVIGRTWFGQTVHQQFKMRNVLSKSQLIKAFGIKSTPDPSDANKLELLFDFLVYFEYLVPDAQGNYALRSAFLPPPAESPSTFGAAIDAVLKGESSSSVVDRLLEEPAQKARAGPFPSQISINLNLSASTTDEELQLLVKKAKIALDLLLGRNE